MIHHPLVLKTKVILILATGLILGVLYLVLSPEDFRPAAIVTLAVVGAVVVLLWIFAFVVLANPSSKINRALTHSEPSKPGPGWSEVEVAKRQSLLDQTGETLSPLRPSGVARINGERVSVVTEGSFVGAGKRVRVAAVEDMRIVVEPAES